LDKIENIDGDCGIYVLLIVFRVLMPKANLALWLNHKNLRGESK
jgi:hypothetical protein